MEKDKPEENQLETKEDIEAQTATLYGLVLQHIKHVADMTLSVGNLESTIETKQRENVALVK